MSEPKVIVITGASSGFGNLTARRLARAGHTVYAGMRAITGRNADKAAQLDQLAASEGLSIQGIEMDVQDQTSIDAAVADIHGQRQRIDVLIHNAGHMVLGPAEAFTPEQIAAQYDVNVVSTQRVNRAVLPIMRAQRSGLVIWIGSSSTRGGHPPFLAPYFAAKAGMDALAESYAAELAKFGVETSIVVPGAYTSGTNHFAHSGAPDDHARASEYDELYGQLRENMAGSLAAIFPEVHEAGEVADEIASVIGLPDGQRPFRVHVDPSKDGSEVVSAVYDRIRAEFYRRIGFEELLGENSSL
ncbi:SDR family oxidoreductase [Glutamicibacter halophytocola]|uniref:SDR family oxidoreductase n=1 Tax=Glutamicibacter halophytocola TaxID=1933880 RepID=UPI001559C126|nr:SDR family oxidoreductase [Glutamicibacter halophytocola]NQD41457.1 SDR family oxidoreductase [Glutamicibacter halophytocola]